MFYVMSRTVSNPIAIVPVSIIILYSKSYFCFWSPTSWYKPCPQASAPVAWFLNACMLCRMLKGTGRAYMVSKSYDLVSQWHELKTSGQGSLQNASLCSWATCCLYKFIKFCKDLSRGIARRIYYMHLAVFELLDTLVMRALKILVIDL